MVKMVKDWENEFEKSGLTIDEWNKAILDKRDKAIEKEVEYARKETARVNEKTQFMVDYINHQSDLEAQRVMQKAEQYTRDILSGKIPVEKTPSSLSIMDKDYLEKINAKTKQWVGNSKIFSEKLLNEAEEKYQEFVIQRERQRQMDNTNRQTQFIQENEQSHMMK